MIGWLLDTNVVAELARRRGEPRVAAWAEAQDEDRLFISALTLGEYDRGVANLPEDSRARARIQADIATLETRFEGRVLSVTDGVVRRWGRISGATVTASPTRLSSKNRT